MLKGICVCLYFVEYVAVTNSGYARATGREVRCRMSINLLSLHLFYQRGASEKQESKHRKRNAAQVTILARTAVSSSTSQLFFEKIQIYSIKITFTFQSLNCAHGKSIKKTPFVAEPCF